MRTVKPLADLMPLLLKQGFTPTESGAWTSSTTKYQMTPLMLTECEKVPGDYLEYDSAWLEERIEYPCIMQMKKGTELVYFLSEGIGVIVHLRSVDSEWNVGVTGGWDMAHFKPYATVTVIGEEDAEEDN